MGDKIPCRKQNPLCMLPNIKEYISYNKTYGGRGEEKLGRIIYRGDLIKYLTAIEKTGSYACNCALKTEDINPAMSNLFFSDH